jgi:hypothetical protein
MRNASVAVGIRIDGVVVAQGREGIDRSVAMLNGRRLGLGYGGPIDVRPPDEQNHEDDGSHGISCKRKKGSPSILSECLSAGWRTMSVEAESRMADSPRPPSLLAVLTAFQAKRRLWHQPSATLSAGGRMVFRGEHDRRREEAGSFLSSLPFLRSDRPFAPVVCAIFSSRHTGDKPTAIHSEEVLLWRNSREVVLLRFRRDGILPLCRAPKYSRQEGGLYGTEI